MTGIKGFDDSCARTVVVRRRLGTAKEASRKAVVRLMEKAARCLAKNERSILKSSFATEKKKAWREVAGADSSASAGRLTLK